MDNKTQFQIWFAIVWNWFVVLGHGRSWDMNTGCVYETETGERCAASVLLTDADRTVAIKLGMNGAGIGTLIHNPYLAPLRKHLGFSIDGSLQQLSRFRFLSSLQYVHDVLAPMSMSKERFKKEMEARLRTFAEDWGLEIPETTQEDAPTT